MGRLSVRAAVITVSTKGSRGERVDESGPALRDGLAAAGHEVVFQDLVPDDVERVATTIIAAARAGANVVLTSGGTGLSPNDVTPEATRRVIDREAPGIAEALRARSLEVLLPVLPHALELLAGESGEAGHRLPS